MTRNYYELQERDLESLEIQNLPLTFSEQFLWNRDFSLRWDFTKNLHFTFQSATRAEIEEPYTHRTILVVCRLTKSLRIKTGYPS